MALQDKLMLEWVAKIRAVHRDRFIALEDSGKIPSEIRLSSKGWFEKVLQPEANPYLPAIGTKHRFSLATDASPDLLCHEYNVKGYQLQVLETRNVILLTVKTGSDEQIQLPKNIDRMSQSLLRMDGEDYHLKFQYPTATEPSYFSTNPEGKVAMLRYWHDRVDGLVEGRAVTFIFYKKVEQLLGYQDDRHWFSEAFRAKASAR